MKTTIFLLLLLLLFSSLAPTAQATPTTAQFIPSSTILMKNDTFTVTIKVSPGQEIDTVAIDLLTWNPTVLECLYIQQGNLFLNPLVWLGGRINNTAGQLTLMVISSPNSTNNPGNFCSITFKARASGISTIAIELLGIARNGTDLPKHILNSCQITVEGQYTPPPINPPVDPPVQPPANNTNQTTPPENETIIPPDNPVDNDTYVPIDNTTDDQNDTTPPVNDDDLPPAGESSFFDNIPTTIIIYLVVAIVLISIFAYIVVRHFQNRTEEKEDQDVDDLDAYIEKNFGGGGDDETDSRSEL